MKTIWKFPIRVDGLQTIEIPQGAAMLACQFQGANVCIWAVCDTAAPRERRKIAIYGTGHPLDRHVGTYLGTFQLAGGSYVGHVFDLGPDTEESNG